MLKARSIGPRMLDYLAAAGIETLDELRSADPAVLAMRINAALGKPHINRLGIAALANLVSLAGEAADGEQS